MGSGRDIVVSYVVKDGKLETKKTPLTNEKHGVRKLQFSSKTPVLFTQKDDIEKKGAVSV
jgi:6-phosphogluconolactonase (cycloisomerase 2 family)